MRNKARSRLASLTLLEIAAGIAVSAVAVPALAAPPSIAPSYNWSGFYVGAHAGYRWADADFTSAAYSFNPGSGTINFPARSENYNLNGGIFGLQTGYNYMFAPQWLIGIEGDWSWGHASDSTAFRAIVGLDGLTLNRVSEVELNWEATIRARVGYAAGPWLLYVTGGGAFAHVKWSEVSTLSGPTSRTAAWNADKTLTGFAVGAGVEYMFSPNWIGRFEYLFEDFGSFDVPHGFSPQVGNLDLSNVQKVRVGISYKFGN
jgi:outer membrane immunogenic protein